MSAESIKVFIAEDSDTARTALKSLISQSPGLEVVGEASDGAVAVEQVQSSGADVVLVDLGLPSLNGIEVTKKLKTANPKLRVIIFTSQKEEEIIIEAFAAGADGYSLKGRTKEHLLSAIKNVRDGVGWLDPAVATMVLKRCAQVGGSAEKTDSESGDESETGQAIRLATASVRPEQFYTQMGEQSPVALLYLAASQHESRKENLYAEAYYHGALALAEKLLGPNHVDVGELASKLGDFYCDNGKPQKAEALFIKALEVRHHTLGDDHEDVAMSLESLADLYSKSNKWADAEKYFSLALKMREKVSSQSAIASCRERLIEALKAIGEYGRAEELERSVTQAFY